MFGKIRHTLLGLTDRIVKSESEPSSKRDIKSHSVDKAFDVIVTVVHVPICRAVSILK